MDTDERPLNVSRLYLSAPVNAIIEGYPIDMQTSLLEGKKLTGYSGFMGIASVYREVGFVEVGRHRARS
ncbi:protein of unknown function [Candidatus Promineifilum breve]|uniref:Uncharacterized protein n=1 Tax=Candidatus Promineifilum breve TaxID=1806508 RepID=A0A170PIJ5_9CHLR|nr:hypothetical protein [Candidatus Promineifilum breve]CUS04893.2 protein of unknown function [Candidatus Promineifilum breve]